MIIQRPPLLLVSFFVLKSLYLVLLSIFLSNLENSREGKHIVFTHIFLTPFFLPDILRFPYHLFSVYRTAFSHSFRVDLLP